MDNPAPMVDALTYQPSDSGYDEAYGSQSQPLRHWQYLLDGLQALGPQGIRERQHKADRILRDDGASYNSGHPSTSQTWPLDPVPMVLESEEWSNLEAGLLERAELLDLMLKDFYGERSLIRHGILPPELLYSHPGFLRACQGIQLPGEHQLLFYAADMIRDQNGSPLVVSDRTQAPSGAGYALENRTVMSRVLPSLFRDSHVHRLSLFFQAFRLKLNQIASQITDDVPRIVILTPGSLNETYFEHGYLANYLGFPLVQGSDLQVSNGYLWMKSLGGLERVDLVLRRVDDFYCDPVELKADSHLGVPGLLEVARAGRVVIANPLGSGVLENPALVRYLPQVSEHFLGRELRLASIPTYWCGIPQDMAYVIENLERLVIKPCFRGSREETIFGHRLSTEEREQLIAQIRRHPMHMAAQEFIRPSLAPAWHQGELRPRPALLRSFAVASQASYSVMPGGLTRAGKTPDSLNISNREGAVSKDTWIIASEPEKQLTLREVEPRTMLPASGRTAVFPCRVVENLFWMGRYAERTESALRLLRTVFVQLNSTYEMPQESRRLLLRAVTELTTTYPGFTLVDPDLVSEPEAELLAVVLDGERVGSVTANLNAFSSCADQVREMLSADTQRLINDLRDQLGELSVSLQPGLASAPEEALDPLVTSLLALSGLWHESMVRGLGWRFMDLGRRVEKALQTVRLLRAALVQGLPEAQQVWVLESILMSLETLMTFRRRSRSGNDLVRGLELLLYDGGNPRSVYHQLTLVQEHLAELPAAAHGSGLAPEDRLILEAATSIQLSEPEQLAAEDPENGQRGALDQLLARLQHLLEETSTQISGKYFDQVKVHHQLVRTSWDEAL
ncbi:circularly permuted type 2 ATP-grasp protein [Motiliproteus sp. SC1-56]|uniref:circularly permuted type 2 ATP-grasp protein n=1 Tax=Motiliproteus sp. SC1-56 TaxID=2799565 RepID=UPI001A8E379C|nr:circularly permuted type 2 ATP-grasp protein [Motiliproteus sp. SC1-56]